MTVKAWAGAILEDVAAIAEIIDGGTDTDDYAQAVKVQAEAVEDADSTPSARVLEEMRRGGNGFFRFAMEAARRNKDYFARLEPLSPDRLEIYASEARDSIRRQQDIEQSDRTGFDEYLAAYYSEQGCC
jgi:glutamate--cysteine ligase